MYNTKHSLANSYTEHQCTDNCHAGHIRHALIYITRNLNYCICCSIFSYSPALRHHHYSRSLSLSIFHSMALESGEGEKHSENVCWVGSSLTARIAKITCTFQASLMSVNLPSLVPLYQMNDSNEHCCSEKAGNRTERREVDRRIDPHSTVWLETFWRGDADVWIVSQETVGWGEEDERRDARRGSESETGKEIFKSRRIRSSGREGWKEITCLSVFRKRLYPLYFLLLCKTDSPGWENQSLEQKEDGRLSGDVFSLKNVSFLESWRKRRLVSSGGKTSLLFLSWGLQLIKLSSSRERCITHHLASSFFSVHFFRREILLFLVVPFPLSLPLKRDGQYEIVNSPLVSLNRFDYHRPREENIIPLLSRLSVPAIRALQP